MKYIGQNPSNDSKDESELFWSIFCIFGLYCLGSSDLESWVKVTGTSLSPEPNHLCLEPNKVARFYRLVHRIECKEEATPFTSEVLVSTAKCFLSPLSGGWHYCTISFWAKSREFVSSSIPSWKIFTAHAQPFRGARDLAFCLKVPLDSLLVWASSGGSGETARMRRLPWTFAARIGDKYQIRLVQPIKWLTLQIWPCLNENKFKKCWCKEI